MVQFDPYLVKSQIFVFLFFSIMLQGMWAAGMGGHRICPFSSVGRCLGLPLKATPSFCTP